MILVDTSVWIRFLAEKEPYASELDQLLARDEVLGHQLIYGELLIADRGGRAKLLAAYAAMHHATVVAHDDVVELVRHRKLYGRGSDGSTHISSPRRSWSTPCCLLRMSDWRASLAISACASPGHDGERHARLPERAQRPEALDPSHEEAVRGPEPRPDGPQHR